VNTCNQSADLERYHDGELSSEHTARMKQHIASCQACQSELASLERLTALLVDVPMPELRPLALEQLHQQLDRHITGRLNQQAERGVMRLAKWLTAAAAVILLVSSMQLFLMQTAPASDGNPSLAWEMSNAMLSQESTTGGVSDEHSFAAWIVSDLSASASQNESRE
jgi:anti-sigma factor RsiW